MRFQSFEALRLREYYLFRFHLDGSQPQASDPSPSPGPPVVSFCSITAPDLPTTSPSLVFSMMIILRPTLRRGVWGELVPVRLSPCPTGSAVTSPHSLPAGLSTSQGPGTPYTCHLHEKCIKLVDHMHPDPRPAPTSSCAKHGFVARLWSRLDAALASPLCTITASRLMTPERETAYPSRAYYVDGQQ